MKTLYVGELKRCEDGSWWVDDTKFDWKQMSEINMSIYLGSIFGAIVEHMRLAKSTDSLFIEVKTNEETEKEVQND